MDAGKGALALVVVPGVMVASLFAFLLLLPSGSSSAATCSSLGAHVETSSLPSAPIDGYAGVQLQNAAAIMNAGATAGISVQGQLVAVMTAMGESHLQILDHGDTAGPDSRGLFQQRDSWGTLADRMDPTRSATLFYTRLTAVPGWAALDPSVAAHTVQRNAAPSHYRPYFPAAQDVVAALGGISTSCGAPKTAGDDYPWAAGPVGSSSPLRYGYRECVDFVAYRLNRDAGTTTAPWAYTGRTLTPLGGNAKDWKASWVAHGWATSHTPTPGSVAWWGAGPAGANGHVAYVQSVNPNGTVTVEEYNWGNKHTYDTRTVQAASVDDFLSPPPRT